MKKILYTIAMLLVLTACNDFLDIKPKGFAIPSKTEDYEKLLADIYFTASVEPLYLTDDVKLIDKTSSASYYVFINQSDAIKNIYSFQGGQLYPNGSKDYLWNDAYSRIFTYNTVINGVKEAKDGSEMQRNRIKSEALIGRALEYFYLVNVYGAQFDSASASSDYGVPYITEGDINYVYERASVQNVYENILADIDEAMPNLASAVSFSTHPTVAAGQGLKAKVLLQMGNYSEALKCANASLSAKSDLLNLNEWEKREGVTWGRVHYKGDPSHRLPDVDHPESVYFRIADGYLRGCAMAGETLRQTFKEDLPATAKDLRKEYYFSEDMANLGSTPTYFPGECAYVHYVDENGGVTTPEVLLIAAECEARVGSYQKAVALINTLRDNRIENNVALLASNKDDALALVLRERRRELSMKGLYRYMDLKRLNKEPAFAVTVSHSADGQTWTLAPNDLKWIFPVNQEILDFRPELPQYQRN